VGSQEKKLREKLGNFFSLQMADYMISGLFRIKKMKSEEGIQIVSSQITGMQRIKIE
jgi:hypothetical protein